MRCTCYCTAASYDIPRLFQYLQRLGTTQLFRDVIHIQIKEDKHIKGDIFYFSYGSVVCWGFAEEDEKEIVGTLKDFEKEPLSKSELDEFTYIYGDGMKIEEDEIVLQNKSTLTKLAISHGLAQSVKLTTFEEIIQKTIDHTKQLPIYLAKRGKIPLSRKEISRKMGEIFIERNFINLHSDILDTPEFFWDYPELESFYRRTAHYLDVTKRGETLNKRLNVVHELFEILSSELNHQHSSRLEITIVLLILIEVTLAMLRDLFHLI
ncbi:MAG: RMD1 family protein [Parachlamydiales bacterium]|nr:RMD1 family protein [Verrucomicrobiota bacterium]MBX3718736.1 RMD1 family protein [Candidatus Acheromyda pituitae]